MNRTATVSARIDPDIKQQAEAVFSRLGLTTSQAITLFFRQVNLQGGLPFEVRLPNAATRQALAEAEGRQGLQTAGSPTALFEELGL